MDTSPTTTDRDREASERLARWAFVGGGPLDGENLESYGEKVLNVGTGLATRDPKDVVQGDLKIYDTSKGRFGVAQVEVTDLVRISDQINPLNDALDQLREQRALDFTVLMVTDIVGGSSRLLLSGDISFVDELPYRRLQDGSFSAEDVVSRKKQLLPVLLALLEG
jgi:manganese-dependent inorganic pyrophosphatase